MKRDRQRIRNDREVEALTARVTGEDLMRYRMLTIAALCGALAPALVAAGASALPLPRLAGEPLVLDVAAAGDPVGVHAAIAEAEEHLAEMDATITVLQDDADKLDGAAKQKARDAVAGMRAIRDTYKKEIDGVVARGREMTADQLAVARAALTAPWTQFEQALDRDVASIKLDVAARKAIIVARIKAEQAYWQGVVADLETSATNLTAEQRAAIDARIARVKAQADAAQLRLTRIGQAGTSAWTALKQGLVNSRRAFDETYRGTP